MLCLTVCIDSVLKTWGNLGDIRQTKSYGSVYDDYS